MSTTAELHAAAQALIKSAAVTAKQILDQAKADAKVTKANLPKHRSDVQRKKDNAAAKALVDQAKVIAKATLDKAKVDAQVLKTSNPATKTPKGTYHFTKIVLPGAFQIKVGPGVLRRIIYHSPITHNPALLLVDGMDSNSVPMNVTDATGSTNPGPGVIPGVGSAFPEEPSSYYVLNYHKAFTNGLRIETKEQMTITVVWE